MTTDTLREAALETLGTVDLSWIVTIGMTQYADVGATRTVLARDIVLQLALLDATWHAVECEHAVHVRWITDDVFASRWMTIHTARRGALM
jgi:hypothetical protein